MPNIAVIPGDGIGTEVVEQGVRLLESLDAECGLGLTFEHMDLGADRYLRDGTTLPDGSVEHFRRSATGSAPAAVLGDADAAFGVGQSACCSGKAGRLGSQGKRPSTIRRTDASTSRPSIRRTSTGSSSGCWLRALTSSARARFSIGTLGLGGAEQTTS